MLARLCSHCREKKRNCKCKIVAYMDTHPMKTKFKAIDEDTREVIYVSQRHPWAQRKGMPQDPLNNFGYNNNSQWQGQNSQNFPPQGKNWNFNWSNQ